ncbi:HAD-IA family hydrolase [Ottowia testudinis]|uniref:HAD-IA family hydrolase n=1 Tax=Ottowia testudinis TaxID=2816950 RepID=A0A975H2P0_9BURK|nr:HAD-IA family hydrolase [Ottowia testudinis]QTD44400.1 HAD-IA family hydrolase [Ottowia testudinis]
MFKGVRCVLFDLDGTLIDSAADLGGAADEMRVARGLPSLPPSHYRASAGSGARGMLGVALGVTPSHADFPALREEFFDRYEQRMTRLTQPFDGVVLVLQTLAQSGIHWGVVTNKSRRFVGPLLATMPAFEGASTIVCGDTTAHTKPHPAPLHEAMRQVGARPHHCIYVGDDERDMLAGRAAGVATVAARYGYLGPDAVVARWPADAVIDFPAELLKLIETA